MSKHLRNALTASLLAVGAIAATAAFAQPFMHGPGMMGPGMMGNFGGHMCGFGPYGFAGGVNDKLADALKLTDAQRAKYEDFKTAARSASETMQNSCNADIGSSMPNRMEGMETRMASMLAAMRTVRPALDAFYSSLTDAQKAQFDSRSGRPGPWHWRGAW